MTSSIYQFTHVSQYKQRAFTLVELSIVLVILGLLVGGVLTGKTLIHAAELRSITTQRDKFVSAIHSFRDKYFMLPGDMTNATQFWGAASNCTTYGNATTGTLTCNGDGDGLLAGLYQTSPESYRFWQHLSNAGLIEGKYRDSLVVPTPTLGSDAINSPSGKYSKSLWYVASFGAVPSQTGGATYFGGNYGNALFFSAKFIYGTAYPLMLPEDVWNIDAKIDDSKPNTGKVMVMANGYDTANCAHTGYCQVSDCTNATDDTTSPPITYLVTSTKPACSIVFTNQF